MNPAGSTLAPYFSRLQLRRILAAGPARVEPLAEALSGAVLFLDVAGFTRVTEALGREGPRGAEMLAEILGAYFDVVIETIDAAGGDVLFFAGDALVAFWPAADADDAALNLAAAHAAQATLQVQIRAADVAPPHDLRLQFRGSLGCGPLTAYDVGGVAGRWLQVVRGAPFLEAVELDRQAQPGDVMVSSNFLARLEGFDPTAERAGPHMFRLRGFGRPPSPRTAARPTVPGAAASVLADLVPRIVAERVAAGQAERLDLAEFRQVSVLFANVGGASLDAGAAGLDVLHRAVTAGQDCIARYDGVLDQLIEQQIGVSILAAFGLPGSSHTDDAVRAVIAANTIRDELRAAGLDVRCAIATGAVFCGIHGSTERRHYSLLGSPINLAARLLNEAEPGDVLCDDATRLAAAARLRFAARGIITPKGFSERMTLFVPVGEQTRIAVAPAAGGVIGRASELAHLEARLREHPDAAEARIIVIEAEAGMGKSTLLAAFERDVLRHPVRHARGAADSLESSTAYYAFREILRSWLDVPAGAIAADVRSAVTAYCAQSAELEALMPLLGIALGLEFPDNDLTRQMPAKVRAENLQRMLLEIARLSSSPQPLVVILEDGHWFDSASWRFVLAMARSVPDVLIVIATRPIPHAPPDYNELRQLDRTEVMSLSRLSAEETGELIRHQLRVPEVPVELVTMIDERAEGNPFFAQELVRALRESGAIDVTDGVVTVTAQGPDGAAVPATLEGVITSRIDRLGPGPQLTLKVASVIGREFEDDLLRHVHPASPPAEELAGDLVALSAAELIESNPRGETQGHIFTHALTHEATYNLLPYARRESLHQATAEALETMHAADFAPVRARLAHHFRLAGLAARAVPHMAGAGEQALEAYAPREAIRFFTNALLLDEQVRGSDLIDIERARWTRQIGQAWYYQDDYARAGEWFEKAMRTTGEPARLGPLRAMGSLLRVLSRGTGPRAVPQPRVHDPAARDRLIEAIRSGGELAAVYLWSADTAKFALNALNMARIARRVGPSTDSPYAIAVLAYLLSVAGLRRHAEREVELAVRMAEASSDLHQIASCNMVHGMVMANHGRFEESVPFLERAEFAADALRAGLYKHRTKYMFAESLLWLGRYERCRALYDEAAGISLGAEPHVAGLANSMVALALLREGRLEEALVRLGRPDCIPLIRREGQPLSMVCGLAVLAEAKLSAGDRAGALAAVAEADAAIKPSDDGTNYFAAILGHAALARVRIETGEPGASVRSGVLVRTPLARSLARVRKVARMFPGGRALSDWVTALHDVSRGRTEAARRRLQSAIRHADASAMPFELGMACMTLADLSTGEEEKALRERAREVFAAAGLRGEAERAGAALAR